MREIAIIGAGQAGVQLAIGLQKQGLTVHLYSDRTAEAIRNGRVLSSQGVFHTALKYERELGLNFWDNSCPPNTCIHFSIADLVKKIPFIHWEGHTQYFYQSIDQRLKIPAWMDFFEKLGGKIIIQSIDEEALDTIIPSHDLTLIATGKGEMGQLFERDDEKSTFLQPARKLALVYLEGVEPYPYRGVSANLIPNVGEYFIMPGLSLSGPCEMMFFEAIPGGPFDCWEDINDANSIFHQGVKLLKEYIPWEAKRCAHAKVTDSQAFLRGSYTPVIRKPILKTRKNNIALGLGDAVVLNDPIAGQGANNASRAAKIYLESIGKNIAGSFDRTWMQETFNQWWEDVKWSTEWTNLFLMPPEPPVLELLRMAEKNPAMANFIANAFDDPKQLLIYLKSEEKTKNFMARMALSEVVI